MYAVLRLPTVTPFVMHDMVDFGDRHHGRVCHVQAFARLLAGIQKTAAEQVSEAGVVPCGVEIAHQHVQIVVMLQLGERVETTVPQTLVAGGAARTGGRSRSAPCCRRNRSSRRKRCLIPRE